MTAVISRDRARVTCLTAATGVLLLAIAVVMMVVAAPAHGLGRPNVKPSAAVFTSDVCHQLTSRSDSATVRACQAGPAADSAWADAYGPSSTSDSWSASSSGRVRPPAASSAAS